MPRSAGLVQTRHRCMISPGQIQAQRRQEFFAKPLNEPQPMVGFPSEPLLAFLEKVPDRKVSTLFRGKPT